MSAKNNIGILTGGGDVPGLNSVIKSVVYGVGALGRNVIGIRKGWKGLTNLDPAETGESIYHRALTRGNTRTIDRTGGTILHTSRTNPSRVACSKVPKHISADRLKSLPFDGKNYDFTSIVIENLERLGIGCLVAIGGDDTLGFAATLSRNGFPGAITRARDAITRQRTTIGSHERIGIFRIFGRDAGFTALYTAYVTGARCLIPECPCDSDRVISVVLEDKKISDSNYVA